MNQNTLTLKIKGAGAGRGGRVWRNQGWIRNNSSAKFADPWLSDTLRKADMEPSDKISTDLTNNNYTFSDELVISPDIFKGITEDNTKLPGVVRKESSVSLKTQIERSMNEFDLMLNMFEEDFEEPSKYFKSSHENVTDSAKLGLRLALTRYATKNAEIRNLCGKTMMGEDFEKIDTQTGEEEDSYVNLNEEISSFQRSEKKVEATVLNSESGYTTTNESSGSEASNSLNSANSSYSSHSKNSLHQPINNLLTYHSVNDLPTNYIFPQTNTRKTHNTSVMEDIDCDNTTPLLLPCQSTKGVYADPKIMVGISAVSDLPPPSGFDYEAILRKKKPKTQKDNDEGLNIDEMKQLNEIFTTEKATTDNTTIQSSSFNTSISKEVVKRKKRLEMDEMSISDTSTNIQDLVYSELENTEKHASLVSSYDNISSNTGDEEYDDDTITNKSLNLPPEPDFIPSPPSLPNSFPIPSKAVSTPSTSLSITQNTTTIIDDDYDYCIEEPFSEQQETDLSNVINTIPLPPPLPCLLPASLSPPSFVQPDSNTSSCFTSFSLTDLPYVHLRNSSDRIFPHINAKGDRSRLTENNVVEAITNSITSGVFKLKATSKGSLIREGIDFKSDGDNNEHTSDKLMSESSYETEINEKNSGVKNINRKISLDNVDLDKKNESTIIFKNTDYDDESIVTHENKDIDVKDYKSDIKMDYNSGNEALSKKINIDINIKKTPPEVPPKSFSSNLQKHDTQQNNIRQNNKMNTKSSDTKTFEDIDISRITGYQKTDAHLPEWRQALIERKNKSLLEKHMQSLQKEAKWKQIPDWKKNLIKEKKKNE